MTFRASLGVTVDEFVERWNSAPFASSLIIDPEHFTVDAGSFQYEFDGTTIALLGYVNVDGDITSAAVVDGTNLLDDRIARATAGLNGLAARRNLVSATEPGLLAFEVDRISHALEEAVELEGDQVFRYASTTSAAERAETVGYYLVADDTGLLWLIAVAV